MKLRHLFDDNPQHRYMTEMRPVFNKKALFSDMTEEFLSPAQPNEYASVVIRFRTAKNNVDRIYCICNNSRQLMALNSRDDLFDYYELKIQLDSEKVKYYFEIHAVHIPRNLRIRSKGTERYSA